MYHYVREIKNSKYPNLKGLEFHEFKKQINYFSKKFNVLSNKDFVEILIVICLIAVVVKNGMDILGVSLPEKM